MSKEIVDTSEFVVNDVDDIEDIAPLPKQDYIAEIKDIQLRKVENRSDGAINARVNVAYFIDVDQFPPDYDLDNAPDGVKLYTPFNGMVVDCGSGSQPSKFGRARWKKFLKSHGYTGPVRFVRRDDLDGDWSIDHEALNMLIGRQVLIGIGHNKFEDEVRAQISSIRPLD